MLFINAPCCSFMQSYILRHVICNSKASCCSILKDLHSWAAFGGGFPLWFCAHDKLQHNDGSCIFLHFSRRGLEFKPPTFSSVLGDWHLLVGALRRRWFMVKTLDLSSLGTQGTRLRKLMKRKTLREVYGRASQRDGQGVSGDFAPPACSEPQAASSRSWLNPGSPSLS